MPSVKAMTAPTPTLANSTTAPSEHEQEVARQMQICNACRYCEGFCAVFPAMTHRLEFGWADVQYLANLCHNCGACLHACQYAPPHEFAVNVPQAMARVRGQTYQRYAWPRAWGRLYQRNGLTLALALTLALTIFLLLTLALNGQLWGGSAQQFYDLLPHRLLVAVFLPVFMFVLLALSVGVRRYWQDISSVTGEASPGWDASAEAGRNVLSMTYLGGGHGLGCNNEDDAFSLARRNAHHLTFYGFMLCFAATGLAALYHYGFGWSAPYALFSGPKLLGVVGGVSLLWGTAWLFKLNLQRAPEHGELAQKPMDLGFIALLFLTSLSGLALWLARSSAALPLLLSLHLGAVLALFVTLPYGKFVHGLFRSAALLRCAVEKRQRQ